MIYELSRLAIAPTRVKDALSVLELASPSHLIACWTTEFGDVNEVLVLRRFTAEEADAAQTMPTRPDSWMGSLGPLLQTVDVTRFAMVPFLPHPEPGAFGPFHEMRTYQYRYGTLEEMLETWGAKVPARVKLSPAPFILYATTGRATTVIHVWAYQDLAHRARIRQEAIAGGIWPAPGGAARWVSQHSALLVPAPFSPVR